MPKVVNNKYHVGKKLDQGGYGCVFKCIDKDRRNSQLVIKFVSTNHSF